MRGIVRWYANMPFQKRLRVAIFMGVLLAFACQGLIIHWLTERHNSEHASANATEAFSLSHRTLRNQVGQLDQLVGDNTMWDDFYVAVRSGNHTWVEKNILESSWIIKPTIIAVLNSNGRLVGDAGPLSSTTRAKPLSFPCVAAALGGKRRCGFFTVNGRLTMVAAAPIRNGQGKGTPAGVLMFARYVDNEVVADLRKWTGMPALLCSDSQVLTGGSIPPPLSQSKIQDWHNSVAGVQVFDLDEGRFATVGPIEDSSGNPVASLIVLSVEPAFATLAAIDRVRVWIAPILAIILAILIGFEATSIVVRPLNEFAAKAKLLAAGDLEARLEGNRSGDVFDNMAGSFNVMASELGTAFDKLEEQNTEIEVQVETLQGLNERMLAYSTEVQDLNEKLQWQNSQLEALNTRLLQLADTDGVTGLLNHRSFHERLTAALAEATRYDAPLSVIMMDVDYFKKFNDDYGHPAGDGALREVAGIIRSLIRETDFAARYGGEEFAIGLTHTDIDGAESLAERIREGVAKLDINITISGGVATLTDTMRSPVELVVIADAALYKAKKSGRNQVIAAPETDRKTA